MRPSPLSTDPSARLSNGVRSLLKGAIERMIIATGIAAVRRRTMRRRTLIVAYHNVVPDGEHVRGDLSLHIPQRQFAEQLDLLGQLGQVVPLSNIGEDPRGDRPRFVITFDDAYAGALSAGVVELKRRSMPATVFAAPGLFGRTPWWDLLASGDTGLIPEHVRNHAMAGLAGRHDAVLDWARRELRQIPTNTNTPRVGTADELKAALDYDGVTVGSHSWSHANLAVVRSTELEVELRKPAEWLARTFGDRYTPWLAYPYGLETAATEQAASAAGYVGAVRVDGGWLSRQPMQAPFALPRLNIARGLSRSGFALRLSGIIARTSAGASLRVPSSPAQEALESR
jgi:peptidoglycan/xylan/chitin deacetylase (PgdA/CDA1 family)